MELPKSSYLRHFGHGNSFGEGQTYYGARHASFFCKILTAFRKGGSVVSHLFQELTILLTARQTSVWELSGFSLTEQAAFHRIFIYSSICGPQVQPTIISFFESCNVVFRRNIPALPFELPGQRFFPTSVPCKEYFGKMNHIWYSAQMMPAGSDGRSPGRFGLDS